jgi:hypothetical protein
VDGCGARKVVGDPRGGERPGSKTSLVFQGLWEEGEGHVPSLTRNWIPVSPAEGLEGTTWPS